MNIDELLRESAPELDHSRTQAARLRAGVLTRATAGPRRSRRRSLRLAIAGTAVAALGIGGVAYATGSVPALFTSAVEDSGRTLGVPADQVPALTPIADVTLPDGSRFAAWRAESDVMWCTAYVDNWDGTQPLGNGGTACGDAATGDLNHVAIAWARSRDQSTYYPVLFGAAGEGVTAVRVTGTFSGTGRPVDVTLPVDVSTASYAAALPGRAGDPWTDGIRDSGLTLELLSADGEVLRTIDGLMI